MRRILYICAALFWQLSSPAYSQAASPEYAVKAAFLYNFAKFVQWPDSSPPHEDDVIITILGTSPFDRHLDKLSVKKINNRQVRVHYLTDFQPDRINNSHILFICRNMNGSLISILSNLAGKPILTVSDIDQFTERGGMIEMVQVDNRIRFHINQQSVAESGLTISSQLLKLARKLL